MPLTETKRASSKVVCKHCSTPFKPTANRTEFCCSGCQFVHELIAAQGLDRFYDLQNLTLPPVKPLVFQKRDYSWLEELASMAERSAKGGDASMSLELQGISCLGCVWLIERLFQRRQGALSIQIQSALGRVDLRWRPGECDVAEFAGEVQRFGYLLGPFDPQRSAATSGATRKALTPLVRRMGLCGAFAMNAMLFSVPIYFGMTAAAPEYPLFTRMAFLLATLSFLTGGTYFFQRAWQGLRQGALHIDLPIAFGLIAAYAGSVYAWIAGNSEFLYFEFVSTFTFLMLVGRWVQQTAIEKNRNRLLGSQAGPGEVTTASGEKLPATELRAGTVFRVAPGQVVPVRSKLCSEAATLGLEWINGESDARVARLGQLVPSGALNCSQEAIQLEAVETWPESILSTLLRIAPREERQTGLENFLRAYIAVILGIAALGFAAWLFYTYDLVRSLHVLTSILVVSCPCAAGVAVPLADELAATRLRRAGVFIREQSLWARALKVRSILFDKTGTLTLETMGLKNAEAPDGLAALPAAQRSVLLAIVANNLHPVSCCLREILMGEGVVAAPIENELREEVGFGLELAHDGAIWRLGRPGWGNTGEPDSLAHAADCEFTRNGVILARMVFGEQVRADATEEVSLLQRRGQSVHILSGDRPEKVARMAEQLGLNADKCHGGLTPGEKADWVRAYDPAREHTLMIGDGANDSLAFNESFCTGTPAVDRGLLEHKADFYFLGRGLSGVRHLLETASMRNQAVRRVIAFAILYNAVTLILSLCGAMSPLLAAILMPASSLVSIALVFAAMRSQ